MVRTQIQLTPNQATQLKRLASASGRSMADLVREGVERLLRDQTVMSRPEQMQRAARLFGTFTSGVRDLSSGHDDHFADTVAARR